MNQFKAEQYDIVLFILDQIKYYTLWYLDDKDGFILNDEETGIMIFKNESAARLFACQNLLPLADDTIWNFVNEYLSGNISREVFWEYAKFKHPTHQISFHTLKALDCLKFEGSERIHE